MLRRLLAVTFVLSLVGASAGAAQVSVGLGGQYVSLSGNDFDGFNAGFGGEGNVLFAVGPSLKVGASAQYSSHGIEGADQNLSALGVFGEGRYLVPMGAGRATPYIAGRAGWMQGKVNDINDPFLGTGDLTGSGLTFGGGVGVMIGLSPSLGLDLNAIFHSVSLGKPEFKTATDTFKSDETVNGTALQIRGGLNFKLGAR